MSDSPKKASKLLDDAHLWIWLASLIILTALSDLTQMFAFVIVLFTMPALWIGYYRGLAQGALFALAGYALVITYAVLTYDHYVDGVWVEDPAAVEALWGGAYLLFLSLPMLCLGAYMRTRRASYLRQLQDKEAESSRLDSQSDEGS